MLHIKNYVLGLVMGLGLSLSLSAHANDGSHDNVTTAFDEITKVFGQYGLEKTVGRGLNDAEQTCLWNINNTEAINQSLSETFSLDERATLNEFFDASEVASLFMTAVFSVAHDNKFTVSKDMLTPEQHAYLYSHKTLLIKLVGMPALKEQSHKVFETAKAQCL